MGRASIQLYENEAHHRYQPSRSQKSERKVKRIYSRASAKTIELFKCIHIKIYISKQIFDSLTYKSSTDINIDFHFTFFSLKAFSKQHLPLLQLSKAYSFKDHLRGRGKHSQNVPKISPSHITQSFAHCKHKGQ